MRSGRLSLSAVYVGGRLQAFDQPNAGPSRSVSADITFARGILQSQLEGVHTKGARQLVERALEGEGPLRRTWSTISTRARLVREHFRAVEPEVGITVQRTGNQCRDADRSSGLRPRIEGKVATQRHQGAVAPSADLQSDAALRRRVSRGQLFLAVIHPSHPPPPRPRH